MIALVRHCKRGNPQSTDRRYLPSLSHPFTLDAVVHCQSEAEAKTLKGVIEERLANCGLELHVKTKIVYCQDGQRKGTYPIVKFDFLGFGFQPRQSKARWGNLFLNFSPAVSAKTAKSIRQTIRSWKIHRWTQLSIEELAASFNPVLRGWIKYYGRSTNRYWLRFSGNLIMPSFVGQNGNING